MPRRSSTRSRAAARPRSRSGDPKHPFFTKQQSVVLGNSGVIDPERIESYIAADGYLALRHVLREMEPAEVVEEIMDSGLRGRGGAGYPTGLKWQHGGQGARATRNTSSATPTRATRARSWTAACWRAIPHAVLEGMAIAAYAVGAEQGYIYVRAEYPLAIERLQKAIKQAKQGRLAGRGILEAPFNFNDRSPDRRRGLRLRRGNRADGLDRGQARACRGRGRRSRRRAACGAARR